VNVYTYREGDRWTLIDTGFSRKAASVLRAFEVAKVPLERVEKIVLTHHHVDHMGGAAYLLVRSRAALECHADDAPYVEGRKKAPMPLLLRLFLRAHPAAVSVELHAGDHVGALQVFHTPGHTPGEIVLYDPARRILFAGDALAERKGKLTFPATRAASNLAQAVESLRPLQQLDVRVMLPGHGVPVREDFPSLLEDLLRRAPKEFLGQ
jgi:glyoxylase-like metal-dependent hydrolase (beta-lactamase superfamily II)